MNKFLPIFFMSSCLFANSPSFEEFLQEEVRIVNEELQIVSQGMESGLDVQQYYYIMGKRVELERIILNWKQIGEE